jgi:xanthine dehydrogenase accessory factor
MIDFLDSAKALLDTSQPFALVTVVSVSGSTPRAAGARMLVRDDGSTDGSVGGGLLEAIALKAARRAISERRSRVAEVPLGGTDVGGTEMICGGQAEVLAAFVPSGDPQLSAVVRELAGLVEDGQTARLVTAWTEADGQCVVEHLLLRGDGVAVTEATLLPEGSVALLAAAADRKVTDLPGGWRVFPELITPRFTAVVCGAGHVAQALVPVAASVGFRVVVVDDRPEFASPIRFPAADRVVVPPSFEQVFDDLPITAQSHVVIVTRGHAHDLVVLEQALGTSAGYVGLMGSRTKSGRILAALRDRGVSNRDLERVHTPIGLPIGAETPTELAISIVAELIAVRAEAIGDI